MRTLRTTTALFHVDFAVERVGVSCRAYELTVLVRQLAAPCCFLSDWKTFPTKHRGLIVKYCGFEAFVVKMYAYFTNKCDH